MKRKDIQITKLQQGSALLVSLIILVVMTLLGLSGMRTSVMEEKMAGNMRDNELAFQAAEAALRDAEKLIQDTVISTAAFDADGTDGFYNNDDSRIWESVDWTDASSLEYDEFDSGTSGVNVSSAPRYVIQHLASVGTGGGGGGKPGNPGQNNYGQGTGGGTTETFTITARGTGGSDSAVVYLQTTFGKLL